MVGLAWFAVAGVALAGRRVDAAPCVAAAAAAAGVAERLGAAYPAGAGVDAGCADPCLQKQLSGWSRPYLVRTSHAALSFSSRFDAAFGAMARGSSALVRASG